MNPDGCVAGWNVGRCPDVIEPNRHSSVVLFTWKSRQNGTSCIFILLNLLKTLVERVRTGGSSIAGNEADRVDQDQGHTRNQRLVANRYSIVRSCSRTLKSMGLSFESSSIRCAYGTNIT